MLMGFKAIHVNVVIIEVYQRVRLDFALTIGHKTDSITVLGSALLLNTSDASVSTLIGNRFVDNMPLNGRGYRSLISIQTLPPTGTGICPYPRRDGFVSEGFLGPRYTGSTITDKPRT